jgi:hypothetical protein
MPTSFLNDPTHWRQRAAVARHLAQKLEDQPSKEAMLRIVKEYEFIAERAEQQANPPRAK